MPEIEKWKERENSYKLSFLNAKLEGVESSNRIGERRGRGREGGGMQVILSDFLSSL